MAQHNVATYHQQGIVKKPPGFGHPAKKKYLNLPGLLDRPKFITNMLMLCALQCLTGIHIYNKHFHLKQRGW